MPWVPGANSRTFTSNVKANTTQYFWFRTPNDSTYGRQLSGTTYSDGEDTFHQWTLKNPQGQIVWKSTSVSFSLAIKVAPKTGLGYITLDPNAIYTLEVYTPSCLTNCKYYIDSNNAN